MTLFGGKEDSDKNNTSSKIPEWVDLSADESISIHLRVYAEMK